MAVTRILGGEMSQYNDEIDSSDVICPYCGWNYQPEGEDFSEDHNVEECEDCGKNFYHYDSISVYHHTEPNCEINGEKHEWESHELRDGRRHDFCSVCGKCRSHRDKG